MANRTVRDAHTIHGTNPQNLIEKVIRYRIYDSKYWKEECFGLNAELLVDKACELRYVGGVYSATNVPTPFLCLILKLLQIQPDKDIIIEFIRQNDFKYARALGAMYLRLTGNSVDIYKYLETLYNDYAPLRRREESGEFSLVHMDEYIEELIKSDRVCSIILQRIQKRHVLEDQNTLEPRISILDDDLQAVLLAEFQKEQQAKLRELQEKEESSRKSKSRSRSRSRGPTSKRRRHGSSDAARQDKSRNEKSDRRHYKEEHHTHRSGRDRKERRRDSHSPNHRTSDNRRNNHSPEYENDRPRKSDRKERDRYKDRH